VVVVSEIRRIAVDSPVWVMVQKTRQRAGLFPGVCRTAPT
jgi:hypothetical protein